MVRRHAADRRGIVLRAATTGDACKRSGLRTHQRPDVAEHAQYRGEPVRLTLNGLPVTGMIRSVKEDKSSTATRWTMTVVSKQAA
jgi:hypothetical protein